MFIENYNRNRQELTKLELNIVDKMLKDRQVKNNTSIHKLAKEYNVSVATISRIVKKLEYNGFVEFKSDLTNYWQRENQKLEKLSLDIIGDTRKTLMLLEQINWDQICNLLLKAKKVMIIGYGINHYLARMMEVKLKIMGIDAIHNTNAYYSRLELKTKNCPDLIIAISKTGKTDEVVSVLKDAYQLRIPSLLIAEQSKENNNFYVQYLIETSPSLEDDLYLDLRLQSHVVIEYLLKKLQQKM